MSKLTRCNGLLKKMPAHSDELKDFRGVVIFEECDYFEIVVTSLVTKYTCGYIFSNCNMLKELVTIVHDKLTIIRYPCDKKFY